MLEVVLDDLAIFLSGDSNRFPDNISAVIAACARRRRNAGLSTV
jgi:hypothetical protein